MSKLVLSFGTPEHGWLSVKLRCGETEWALDVSDVPGDSLAMLASSVFQVVEEDATEATVTWFLEPEEETWTFRRAGDVFSLDARTRKTGKNPIRIAQGSCEEICTPIWRALRRLQVDPAWSSSDSWSQPFPTREVEALGVALGRRHPEPSA
jgi:hypothetical protein